MEASYNHIFSWDCLDKSWICLHTLIFSFFVDNTLLKMSLSVMKYALGVVTSPGKLIKSPPTVIWVRCVSVFCGLISATILPYVTVLPAGTSPLGMKKMVFVPGGILVLTPYAIGRFHLQINSPNLFSRPLN